MPVLPDYETHTAEWDEPEGCGNAGNFRGLGPKIGRRSSCPSDKKIIEHARQRVHEFTGG